MQKFTRPITREVEISGERLAFTFSDQGIAIRPVGSRKPPKEISWGALITHMTSANAGAAPGPEQISAALEQLHGPGAKPAPKPASEPEPEPAQSPSAVSPTAPPP